MNILTEKETTRLMDINYIYILENLNKDISYILKSRKHLNEKFIKELLDTKSVITSLLKIENNIPEEDCVSFLDTVDSIENLAFFLMELQYLYNFPINENLLTFSLQWLVLNYDYPNTENITDKELTDKLSYRFNQLDTYWYNIVSLPKFKNLYLKSLNNIFKNLNISDKKHINTKDKIEIYTDETEQEKAFHVNFQVNKNCNFKCAYCYEGLDKVTEILKLEDVPKIVKGLKDLMNELSKPENGGYTKINFSILGGEATLINKIITQELTYLLNEELNLGYITLITNGFDHQKYVDFFHPDFPEEKIQIQVSYDGGIIHDKQRLGPKKESTKKLVIDEIIKYLDKYPNRIITLKATLPFENIENIKDAVDDYLEIEKIFLDKNKKIGYYPTMDTTSIVALRTKQEILNNPNKINDLIEDLDDTFEYIYELEIDRLIQGKHIFTRWFREIKLDANQATCGVGRGSMMGIDHTGAVRGCHRTEYVLNEKNSKYFDFGDIENTENLIEKFKFSNKAIKETISSTDFKTFNNCNSCITLSCIKCPMVNLNYNIRQLDTPLHTDTLINAFSHNDNLTCTINNYISNYLFMYYHVLKKFNLTKFKGYKRNKEF